MSDNPRYDNKVARKRDKDPRRFQPKLSSFTNTHGGMFHEEGWSGGDFFVSTGEKLTVKEQIELRYNGKTLIAKRGDIIEVVGDKEDFFIIKFKNKKYTVRKDDFTGIAGRFNDNRPKKEGEQ